MPPSIKSVTSSLKNKFSKKVPSSRKKEPTPAEQVKASAIMREKKTVKQTDDTSILGSIAEGETEAAAATKLEEMLKNRTVDKTSGTKPSAPAQPGPSDFIPAPVLVKGSNKTLIPLAWEKYSDCGLYAVQQKSISNYIPNDLALDQALESCHKIMAGNRYLRKAHPGYLPLAVNLYMFTIKQLRVFQVRQAYSANSTAGTQLLTRFEKFMKLDDLPIPIAFRAHIEAVAAYKPNNDAISYLLPFLPDNLGGNAQTDIHSLTSDFQAGPRPLTSLNGMHILQTLAVLPILRDWMRYYIDADLDAEAVQTAAVANPATAAIMRPQHNYKGLFVPFFMGTQAEPVGDRIRHLAGFHVPRVLDADTTQAFLYMNSLGTNHRHANDFVTMQAAQPHWKGSAYANVGPQLSTAASDFSTPALWFGFDQSYSWINDLIEHVNIFANYMGGMTTLGALSLSDSGTVSVFNTINLNPGTILPTWFVTNARFHTTKIFEATSTVTIYEEDLDVRHVSAAKFTNPNAKIIYHYRRSDDQPGHAARTNEYLTSTQGARVGPFFGTQVNGNAIAASPDKFVTTVARGTATPIFDGISDLYRSNVYTPQV